MAECQMEIKNQSGCPCEVDEQGGFACNCDGQVLGLIQDHWQNACYSLGALGFVGAAILTGIPALYVSLKGSKRCFRVTCYSACSALLFLPFLGTGAVFIAVALVFHFPGPVSDYLDNCEQQLADLDISSASASSDCGLTAFCDALKALSKEVAAPAVATGLPFAIAGLCMLFGQCACCCCAKSLPGSDKVLPSKYKDDPAEDAAAPAAVASKRKG